jgi:hypothetical protein
MEFDDDIDAEHVVEEDDNEYEFLSHEQAAHTLEHSLENRPDSESMAGMFKNQRRSSLSNVLAGVASELEHQMVVDKVSQSLETRPSEQQLQEMGVIRGRRNSALTSNVLAASVVELEVSIL